MRTRVTMQMNYGESKLSLPLTEQAAEKICEHYRVTLQTNYGGKQVGRLFSLHLGYLQQRVRDADFWMKSKSGT